MRSFANDRGIHQEDLGHRLIMYVQEGHELYREVCSHFPHERCILRTATLEDVFLGVISFFGLVSYPEGLLILLVAFLGGIAFGAIGIFLPG
jgi:hypothetical protein